jgi:hypothetical protein
MHGEHACRTLALRARNSEDARMLDRAKHEKAHTDCFVAGSVNFPIHHDAAVTGHTP